jgi:predicted phage terminase large subunit-like protein
LASQGKWKPAPHLNLLTKKLIDLEQRRTTRLLVEMPPRHGKSNLCSMYFPAWYLGLHPDHNVILASYEGHFAQFWGERARDAFAEYGPRVFGVGVHRTRQAGFDWRIGDHLGRMRCTGLTGGITGRGADLIIIDDPIKDALEAQSIRYRQRAWDWYASTARTRLEPGGIIIVIQTRWHQEDLIGRLRRQAAEGGEQWESLTMQAIYDDPSQPDPMGREIGEALWPKRFPREVLQNLKETLPGHWWEALYQQRPTPPGGSLAQAGWFPILLVMPHQEARRVRYWDCAGTAESKGGDSDYTVGALMARFPDGRYVVEDIIRGRWSSADVDRRIVQTALLDGPDVPIREEQEPGSAGLAIINMRKKSLAGYNYAGAKPMGKPDGWAPLLIQAEVGNVFLYKSPYGNWHEAFLSEVAAAPHGSHDDQLDAVSGAFQYLSIGSHLKASDILDIGGGADELRSAFEHRVF